MIKFADMGSSWAWVVLAGLSGALALGAPRAAAETPLLAAKPGQDLSFTVGNNVHVANITREGLSSDGVELRRSADHLRGRVGAEPVDIRLEPERLDGSIGDHKIALDVWRSGDRLQIAGEFGERTVGMSVSLKDLHAQVGPCWYKLTEVLGSYWGYMSCGGPAEQVELKVPVSLVARDDRELAAMLTALFAR
jgi:hypothetical protein